MTVAGLIPPRRPGQGLPDGASQDELLPQDPQGPPQGLPDQGLAAALQAPAQGPEQVLRRVVPPLDEAARQHQGPGGGVDEE
jgi:hypothetical protein